MSTLPPVASCRQITSRREGQTSCYALDTTVLEDGMAWTMTMARGAKGEKK